MPSYCPHCRKPTVPMRRKAIMGMIRSSAFGTFACPECGARLAVCRFGAFVGWLLMASYVAWLVWMRPPDRIAAIELVLVGAIATAFHLLVVPMVEIDSGNDPDPPTNP